MRTCLMFSRYFWEAFVKTCIQLIENANQNCVFMNKETVRFYQICYSCSFTLSYCVTFTKFDYMT